LAPKCRWGIGVDNQQVLSKIEVVTTWSRKQIAEGGCKMSYWVVAERIRRLDPYGRINGSGRMRWEPVNGK
jgi:hypothetical protein